MKVCRPVFFKGSVNTRCIRILNCVAMVLLPRLVSCFCCLQEMRIYTLTFLIMAYQSFSHDHLRNEAVLLRVKEQRNILHEISKGKANWIGHILRRNCLLQRFIEGKMKGGVEVTGRRGRRRRNLLGDIKERRGYSHF
jgi:hypothetical protein